MQPSHPLPPLPVPPHSRFTPVPPFRFTRRPPCINTPSVPAPPRCPSIRCMFIPHRPDHSTPVLIRPSHPNPSHARRCPPVPALVMPLSCPNRPFPSLPCPVRSTIARPVICPVTHLIHHAAPDHHIRRAHRVVVCSAVCVHWRVHYVDHHIVHNGSDMPGVDNRHLYTHAHMHMHAMLIRLVHHLLDHPSNPSSFSRHTADTHA